MKSSRRSSLRRVDNDAHAERGNDNAPRPLGWGPLAEPFTGREHSISRRANEGARAAHHLFVKGTKRPALPTFGRKGGVVEMKTFSFVALLGLAAASTLVSAPASAQVPPPGCLYGTSTDIVCNITPNDVIVDGHVVGRDPDPHVRAELRRDAPQIYGY